MHTNACGFLCNAHCRWAHDSFYFFRFPFRFTIRRRSKLSTQMSTYVRMAQQLTSAWILLTEYVSTVAFEQEREAKGWFSNESPFHNYRSHNTIIQSFIRPTQFRLWENSFDTPRRRVYWFCQIRVGSSPVFVANQKKKMFLLQVQHQVSGSHVPFYCNRIKDIYIIIC